MDVRILGPFEVRSNGGVVDLGGPRPISLLAVLVLSAGEVVSTDRLVEELWGESPPRSAQHLLHVYVSSLRKALHGAVPRQVLVTRAPGYVVELEPDELDVRRFERLLGEGRRQLAGADAEAAARTLRDGLALWRGPALADFTYEPFAQTEIARLEELRVAALEERIEADLALGLHAELVGELEALVAQSPLRERARGQLMLALYRSGRQVEALETYREAHRALVEELGIEPGPALRRLEQAILDQDPALELEAPIEATTSPGTRKLVTAVVASLADEGKLDGFDPEARRRVVASALDTVSGTFKRHGGTVERSIGEEVVAVFGVPVAHEDDALRAVRAAFAARDAIASANAEREREWEVRLDVRSSIDTGEVVFEGNAIVGDTVPRAIRLNSAAARGEIVVGESTYRLVQHAVLVDVGSGDGRVTHPRVVAVLPDAVPLPRRLDSVRVGRQRELDHLRNAAERAFRDRAPQVVTVVGEAGLGKSRLAQDLASLLDDGATQLVGRCISYGDGLTFAPLRDVVRQAAGDVSRGALARLLDDADDRDTTADTIATAIGSTTAKVRREETFGAFRTLFAAIARPHPLLLVFEDVHWGEPMFLDLVEHLAGWTRDAPLLILCLARPELLEQRPAWMDGNQNAARIMLQPLSDDESARLLDNLASEATLPDAVRSEIVGGAEGNPLFLEQLFAMVAGERQPDERGLPPTIRAVLAARLDRLGPGERAVAERASIVGRDFQRRAVVDLLPDAARASAHRQLQTLVRRRLVEPRPAQQGEGEFRFQHALIHEAAYRAIPKALRAELHERYAEWLAADAGQRLGEIEEVLGHHLERAWRYSTELAPADLRTELAARAARHLAASGSRALDRGDIAAATGLLERALSLAPRDTSSSAEIMYRLSEAHDLGGRHDRAGELRSLALQQARDAGDRTLELSLVVAESDAGWGRAGAAHVVDDLIQHVIPELVALGDDRALARALSVVGRIAMAAGRHVDALAAFERALEHAHRAGDVITLDDVAVSLVNVMGDGPTPVRDALKRAEMLRAALGPVGAVGLGATTGFLLGMQGRIDEARSLHAQTRARFEEMGIRSLVIRAVAGETELLAGHPVCAERELAAAWDLISAGHQATPWITERRARALRELGRLADAQRFLEIAERHVSPAEGELVARTRATRALIRLDGGDLAGAVEDALEAERLSEPLESPPFESPRYRGEILLAVARVLSTAGRPEAAAQRAVAAVRQFERKGDVVSAERARELIGALERAASESPTARSSR